MFNKKGFTLIEILIVVAIIAILAGIVLVSLGPARSSGADARRIADLQQVRTALELYYNRFGGYPADLQTLLSSNVVPNLPATSLGKPFVYGSTDPGSYVVGVVLDGGKPQTAGDLYTGTDPIAAADASATVDGDCSADNIYCVYFGGGTGLGTSGGTTSGGTTSGGTTSGGTTSGGTTSGAGTN